MAITKTRLKQFYEENLEIMSKTSVENDIDSIRIKILRTNYKGVTKYTTKPKVWDVTYIDAVLTGLKSIFTDILIYVNMFEPDTTKESEVVDSNKYLSTITIDWSNVENDGITICSSLR